MKPAFITVATSRNPQRLTKRWFVNPEGKPQRDGAGDMQRGKVHQVEVNTPAEFAELVTALEPNQALMFGIPPRPECEVVVKNELPSAPNGTIARTKDHLTWHAGPGWMILDGDPIPGMDPLSRNDWLSVLFNVCPAMRDAPSLWSVTGSSCIVNAETDQAVTGVRGQRLWVKVADARDIPRAGKALFDRLWLAGHGRVVVSKAGSTLLRGPVDGCTWQTNRLDFAASPVCEHPLEQRKPDLLIRNNDADAMNTLTALPDLSAQERQALAEIIQAARADDDLQLEIDQTREAWIDERVADLPADLSESERLEARERLRIAVIDSRLFGDFVLIHSSGKKVTVGALLDDPDRWHGERFHDPLEPTYGGNDRRIAWANLRSGGPPYIYSHAHHGKRYRLLRPVSQIKLVQGELPQTVGKVLDRVRLDGEIFERGGQLARIVDGELLTVAKGWLQTYLEGAFQFLALDKRSNKWESRDCPDRLATRILDARGTWDVPKAAGVISCPVMRPDGSILNRAGFDRDTGLILLDDDDERPELHPLRRDDLNAAIERIWKPFELFPFDGPVSSGVFFAALLTTMCRPALDTAPGFLIRAYTPGTGKTLLSECLMLLVGGSPAALPLPEANAEEIEKRLFAKLLRGNPGLILDNLVGVIDNASLAAFLTSAEPEGRILGLSETRSVRNRALWVLNGNHVTAGGDTFRRILPITLDANHESPESRRFTFSPKTVIRDRLSAYRADVLNVLLTYQSAGAPTVAAGSMGSFEQWERLVRQCVCWLIDEGLTPVPMADPLEVMTLSKAEDPGHTQHGQILELWHRVFGNRIVQVRDLGLLVNSFDATRSDDERELARAVGEITPARGGFTGRYFAGWLRRHRGRVVRGLRLDPGDPGRDEPGWRVTAA